ncbi:MAG TPA: L,D-transpeptidase family protein, partial [Pseudonocardiaceae bacterium]|nr:L,D-transpeptidase family protein [Pseudonocardiaceae bacterium]
AATGPATAPAPAATRSSSTRAPAPAGPLTVTSISPRNGLHDVATSALLTVDYSLPVDASSPTPTLSPAVPGTWTRSGSVMTFVPAGGWVPYSTEHVTVPAGATATVGGTTITSTKAVSSSFQVQPGSETRLEQLLAQLHYLPFTFVPATPVRADVVSGGTPQARSTVISTSPLAGSLRWSWPTVPATLRALWKPGHANVMVQGAVMAFQSDHDMKMDGVAGPQVWKALLAAAAKGQNDKNPYDYLVASKSLPEKLTVYRDGKVIYTTLANTGVPGADTQAGTFPVYLRFKSTTMRGTNVDGTKYDDPGIPWVAYFNGGDAVHGFVRGAYGFPQSNGCVELPVSNAAKVWTMDPYGTLVTVT